MKQCNLWNYLKLDSFGIEISYSISKTELIHLFQEKEIPFTTLNGTQIAVTANIFSLNIDFSIDFCFDKEKLIAIMMSPKPFLEGRLLYSRYNEIQKVLENELGHMHHPFQFLVNLLAPDGRLARWRRNGIKIEHYLLNRFGMEEIIQLTMTTN